VLKKLGEAPCRRGSIRVGKSIAGSGNEPRLAMDLDMDMGHNPLPCRQYKGPGPSPELASTESLLVLVCAFSARAWPGSTAAMVLYRTGCFQNYRNDDKA
jgi:hypothetical protein